MDFVNDVKIPLLNKYFVRFVFAELAFCLVVTLFEVECYNLSSGVKLSIRSFWFILLWPALVGLLISIIS